MAEDKRITGLGVLTNADAADVFPIVDVSDTSTAPTGTTKQIRTDDLFASPQPIGSSTPDTGAFTTLALPAGSTINEFSTDVTFTGASDLAVPTELAVKTYVDVTVASFVPDRIEAGDSSVIVADSTAAGSIDITVDASLVANITLSGLQLTTGARVNEFSTDTTLIDSSDTAVPTERAVKIYVDNQIASLEVQSDKNDYMLPPQEIAQNSIYTLTESAKIKAIYDQQLSKVTATVPAIGALKATPGDIEDLENGNYAVTTTNGVDCYLSIIGPDGTTVLDNIVVSDLDSDPYDSSELVRLQNGKIAVLYSASTGGLKFRFYDPDGNVLDSTSQHSITTNVVGQFRCARLTNEKFFVVFSDVTDGQTKYVIINEDGTQFITEQTLHSAAANYLRATTLTNGNVIITYQDIADSFLYFKIIDAAGSTVVGKTQVSDSTCPGSPNQPVDIASLPNGNAFITYVDNSLNAHFKIFNGYGAELFGETTYVTGGNIHWVAATYIPDGRVFAVAYNSFTPLTYYTVIDRDGSTVTQWTENSAHHQYLYSVTGKSGKMAVVWVDTTDPNAYVEIYEGLGVQIDGWFELATGSRVNEISNDPTMVDASVSSLVTEYAAKGYVDSQISAFSLNKIYQGDTSVTAYDNTSLQSVIVVTPIDVPGPDSTSEQVLYFDTYGFSDWNGGASINDGNIITFGRAGLPDGTYTHVNTGLASFDSTAIITTETILSVEIRVRSRQTVGMPRLDLIPVFNGTTDGDTIDLLGTATAPAIAYTPWVDITNDSSGPGTGNWTWADVQNLDARLEGDATASNYYEISIVQVRVKTTTPGPSVESTGEVATFDKNGIKLLNGVAANEISNDGTLGDNSSQAIPTEYAVKTYVDNQVIQAGGLNVISVSSDSTAVNHDAILVDTTSSNVNISLAAQLNAQIIIKKISSDLNTVIVSVSGGLIDGASSFTIDSVNKAVTFISDGTNFYVV